MKVKLIARFRVVAKFTAVLAVIAGAAIFFSGAASSQTPATSGAPSGKTGNGVIDPQNTKPITAADRLAAAGRARDAGASSKSMALDPNATPDYFGTIPNFANSPLPDVNATGPDFWWAWYDNVSLKNWVLMANPSGASYTSFNLSIAGKQQDLGDPFGLGKGTIPTGKTFPYITPGIMGGPVKATPSAWGQAVVSQRSLLGDSFEEVPGTESGKLSDHFYWSWYDMLSPGYQDWVMVSNPSATETVHAVVSFTNQADGKLVTAEADISPNAGWTPTFPGKMGGPVEVKAYKAGGSWPADLRNVIASQRVLTNSGKAFNELPGIPVNDLSTDYLWTWYDQKSPGFANWVMIANPDKSHPVNYQIKVAGAGVASGSIPAGGEETPSFPGVMDGPVEVITTGNGGGDGKVIASQRSLAGPSFEEVPGKPVSSLGNSYTWTWYDMQSPGVTNWVLIANTGASSVNYTIKIAGSVVNSGTLPAGGRVTPVFPGQMNGPVEVSASGPVMASQRVMWKGYFNEVLGVSFVKPDAGIRKFVDSLPGAGAGNTNDLGQFIPVAVPDTTTFSDADYYEFAEVQYSEKMNADLPPTAMRGYVQIETPANAAKSQHVPLKYPDGSPILNGDNQQVYGVTAAHNAGPEIVTSENRPVRVKYTNYLPRQGMSGAIYLPVDPTYMGAGEGNKNADGSACDPSQQNCAGYTNNRAVIHLHGGDTAWISDGTPQQWRVDAQDEVAGATPYTKGADYQDVPDMWFDGKGNLVPAGTPGATNDPGPGSTTLFYSNQQSARLMFIHDHAYGITRLNVYDGMYAPYQVNDPVEQGLVNNGTIPSDQVPLIIADKTYVPDTSPGGQLDREDPTWNVSQWGGKGSLWFPHVYMPNQNPWDSSGINAMGRWDYGPWFWPPFTGLKNGPVANPYAGQPGEPPQIPGTPSPSGVPEAFMDTPTVNGTAYPYMKVQRKAYRFRILNASNDRYLNLQLYYASSNTPDATDPATGAPVLQKASGEVPMVPAKPNMGLPAAWPTDGRDGGAPDPAAAGPQMIQIGNEGGFLPAPVVLDNTPVGYEYNRRSITVLNVTNKTLLLAPAERADVIVDFSQVPEGSKIILYNDAPAPLPGFDTRNDYYTGDPDQTGTGGAPTTVPGYGPDTRTVMQFQVSGPASAPFNLGALQSALPAAYAQTQAPPIVPQAPYDVVFGKNYPNNNYSTIQATSLNFFNGPLLGSVGFINITNGGSGYNAGADARGNPLGPKVEIAGGGGQGATGQANVDAGGHVTGVTILDPGTGYTSAPSIVFVGGGGSGATATAALASAIQVTDGGSGYTAPPAVNITGGDGGGAAATSTIDVGGVTGIKPTAGGSGYVTAPKVTIDPPGGGGTQATATATIDSGAVTGITITNTGSGFSSTPAVAIDPPGGNGTTAAATAEISGVTGVIVTNPGAGYTSPPTVTIDPPGGGGTRATGQAAGMTFPMKPKSIIEDFDTDYGRMNNLLGVEMPHTNIQNQTSIPQKYIDPPTEEFKASDVGQPIGVAADGTQIWKITHNGVDTHAIHFHLYNVQVINRVGWDGTIKPPDPNELGWKDTVRMNPLEDAIVAFRPVAPTNIPFTVPDSVRTLDTTSPQGSTGQFTNVDPTGNPVNTVNAMFNFGWQYVWHCHLLGHEENDMMRPQVFRTGPLAAPSGLAGAETSPGSGKVSVSWTNVPAVPGAEWFVIQRATDAGFTANVTAFEVSANADPFPTAATDSGLTAGIYYYRIRAENAVQVSDWANAAAAVPVT